MILLMNFKEKDNARRSSKRFSPEQKQKIVKTLGVNSSTYYSWRQRKYQHRLTDTKPAGRNPHRLLDWEKEPIVDFYIAHQGKDVRIAAYHPQGNGIEERFHRTLRSEGLVSYTNIIEVKQKVGRWIEYYNKQLLHSAIDYMAHEV